MLRKTKIIKSESISFIIKTNGILHFQQKRIPSKRLFGLRFSGLYGRFGLIGGGDVVVLDSNLDSNGVEMRVRFLTRLLLRYPLVVDGSRGISVVVSLVY